MCSQGASERQLIDLNNPPVSFETPTHVFRLRSMLPASNQFLEAIFDYQDFINVEDVIGVFEQVHERTIKLPYDVKELKSSLCSDPSVDEEHTLENARKELTRESSISTLTSLIEQLMVDSVA